MANFACVNFLTAGLYEVHKLMCFLKASWHVILTSGFRTMFFIKSTSVNVANLVGWETNLLRLDDNDPFPLICEGINQRCWRVLLSCPDNLQGILQHPFPVPPYFFFFFFYNQGVQSRLPSSKSLNSYDCAHVIFLLSQSFPTFFSRGKHSHSCSLIGLPNNNS